MSNAGVPGQLVRVSSVGVPDDSSEAFSGGGEVVFELFDAASGGVGLACAGVAFCEVLAVRGFQRGDPVRSVRPGRVVRSRFLVSAADGPGV